ncbi:hypothetical protein HMPREF9502_01920 [Enterococcus faecalis TX0031]|nr:hypothetical protein HMPREF9502_01920 [Enterococcus faecalis TX0031]EOJ74738.1 hypothetical protein WMW_00027 [Enterococcus faecalis EnGen0352]
MYCRKCGKEITDESKYCQFCGALQETDETTGVEIVKKSTEQTFSEMKEQIVHGQETGKLYLVLLLLLWATYIEKKMRKWVQF